MLLSSKDIIFKAIFINAYPNLSDYEVNSNNIMWINKLCKQYYVYDCILLLIHSITNYVMAFQ